MPSMSRQYRKLTTRLDELRRHLLGFLPTPPTSRISYTDQELDATRAYILLAHAEIETFCEELVLKRAITAKQAYDTSGRISPSLRRMVAYHVAKKGKSWAFVTNPPTDVVESAFQSIQSTISENNGVKSKNLERLLFPLGVPDHQLDPLWLADMDSFGSSRGGWAHKSVRVQQPPDPPSQLGAVNQILIGLLELDRTLGRLR